jgi:hypothetical protein
MLKAPDFQELVDAAITMEDDFKQVQEDRRKKARIEPRRYPDTKPTPFFLKSIPYIFIVNST